MDKTTTQKTEMVGQLAIMEEVRSSFKILKDNPIGKTPLGKLRRRWVENIKTNLK